MKKIILLFCLLFFSAFTFAQQTYTVDNETLGLKTETEGNLNFLWNTINEQYLYFIITEDGKIIELKKTKGINNKYQEEYKTVLAGLTSMDIYKVNLTTCKLKSFINKYNSSKDYNYVTSNPKSKIKLRLGAFGELANNPFNLNPKDEKTAFFGTELEAVSESLNSKYTRFLNVKHTTKNDNFQYYATLFSLGYRYHFINKVNFNIYPQTKFAIFTSFKSTATIIDPNNVNVLIEIEGNSSGFDTPFIFGLDADIKLGNVYLTLIYDSIFAVFIDNQDNFLINLAVDSKFNL